MKEKINKIKIKYNELIHYLKIISDFQSLNKYVFYSSIFINRVDKLLKSDLDSSVILYNLQLSYSDFKIEYIEDFDNGVSINNKFERRSSQ